MKKINLLGSGGSIGTQTAEVCRLHGIGIHSAALKSNYKRLAEQAKEFGMKRVCIFDEEYVKPLKNELFGTGTEILTGMEGLCVGRYCGYHFQFRCGNGRIKAYYCSS